MGPGCTGGRGGRCRAAPHARSQWDGRGGQTTGAGPGHRCSRLGSVCWKRVQSAAGPPPLLRPHELTATFASPALRADPGVRGVGGAGQLSRPGHGATHLPRHQPGWPQPASSTEVGNAAILPAAAARGGRSPSQEEAVGESSRAPCCAARPCPVPPLLHVVVAGGPQAIRPTSPPLKRGERAPQGRSRRTQPRSAGPGAASRRAEFSPCRQQGGNAGDAQPPAATRTKHCPKVLPDGLFSYKLAATAHSWLPLTCVKLPRYFATA
ncbi:uncharacterized protein LOC112530132 [Gallus gallus]|uniref:uncharacterized protein LOC112530132 n=1 Tax=Gallus gallus TaxID=9031 RepID=UPI001AE515DC|nr:uncharacterized protein LOC112530132 [Gallus gallus]XP_040543718.1 uncharacterized protein LOC112530132 [Gallus gallus]